MDDESIAEMHLSAGRTARAFYFRPHDRMAKWRSVAKQGTYSTCLIRGRLTGRTADFESANLGSNPSPVV